MDARVRIKQLMQSRGISEYRLAKMSNLSQSTISNIFNRHTEPTIPTIEAICKGFGISTAQFFCEESSETPVYLTEEQIDLFNKWSALSPEQKKIIEDIIDSYRK